MSFYVILPSNTPLDGNKTSSFRVRLPRKLSFQADWSVGLACFVYPHTWPALGAQGADETLRIQWRNGMDVVARLPPSALSSPQELCVQLNAAIVSSCNDVVQRLELLSSKLPRARESTEVVVEELMRARRIEEERHQLLHTNKTEDDDYVDDGGDQKEGTVYRLQLTRKELFHLELSKHFSAEEDDDLLRCSSFDNGDYGLMENLQAWIGVYRSPPIKFTFFPEQQRFQLDSDHVWVRYIELTEQLAFILGFPERLINNFADMNAPTNQHRAKFMPDLSGGISALYVYAPGLIEPTIVGDCTAPLLRVVIVRGVADEVVEDTYVAIQYHRLLTKELSEIQIDICGSNGKPMPFQYGNSILTLHFKKSPYF